MFGRAASFTRRPERVALLWIKNDDERKNLLHRLESGLRISRVHPQESCACGSFRPLRHRALFGFGNFVFHAVAWLRTVMVCAVLRKSGYGRFVLASVTRIPTSSSNAIGNKACLNGFMAKLQFLRSSKYTERSGVLRAPPGLAVPRERFCLSQL